MNISELARRLKLNTEELREKLPELGFDIGKKAIKINDQLAGKIIKAWREEVERMKQKEQYEKITQKIEKNVKSSGEKIKIPSVLTVKDFAELLDIPVTMAISELMKAGVMASMNQRIDYDTAAIIAGDLGYSTEEISLDSIVEVDKAKKLKDTLLNQTQNIERPPVVVVMGHVDHGKTKLLDAIRQTNVVAGEAGGITQHIGAYQVEKRGKKITFIDTPGHEAFSAMRSRGAKVADIAILVVAANEGVKPQTVEALKIAQESGVPIIVAINKIDLPDANPDKVKQELSNFNLLPEEWGGNTIYVEISAKFNKNIDGILDAILLITEMEQDKIKADPTGEFIGSVVESHVDKGEGPVATVLVKNGTLRLGDYIVIDGVLFGKIRLMKDYLDQEILEAGPSMPARILGLKVAPKVGDLLEAVDDPKKVKKAKKYQMEKQDESFISHKHNDDETEETEGILNLILRADVLGSQEAIIEALTKIGTEDFKVKIVSKGLGNITESDVLNAEATNSIILGFNVLTPQNVDSLAQDKAVEIYNFKIIYELLDLVKEKAKTVMKTELIREDLGKIKVLAIFKKADASMIIGGKVLSGKIESGSSAAVLRGEDFIASGKITELKIGKENVADVVKNQECGLRFEGQPIIEVDDILDVYREKEVKKTL